jgi:hypothetical protein
MFMGDVVDIGAPSSDTVSTATIQDDAVTAAKLANSINTEIAANTAKVTNATHTGDVTGATALTIAVDAVDIAMLSATGTADSTTFLRGDNAWTAIASADNTPSFYASNTMGISISNDTWTKVTCDSEAWDTDSAYDNSSDYRFTVPTGEAGKYMALYGVYIPSLGDGGKGDAAIRKNGSEIGLTEHRHVLGAAGELRIHGLAYPLSLAESDYIEFWTRQISGGTLTVQANLSYFGCYKLAGV